MELATRHKRIGNAKQFFQDAVDRELIRKNPFASLESSRKGNTKRQFFVSLEVAQRVLDACDPDWQLIFALCRFGGLRCPSEVLGLRLADIAWDRERFLVHSPKTEHHEGKASRWAPIFPELRPYLLAARDRADVGQEYCLARFRGKSEAYLRTMLTKTLRRVGLEPWPKLFQNLRSSRQTELEEKFPSHVVCAWIGNSLQVARAHYLQITDDYFRRAIAEAVQQTCAKREANRGLSEPEAVHLVTVKKHTNPDEIVTCANSSGSGQWALEDSNL